MHGRKFRPFYIIPESFILSLSLQTGTPGINKEKSWQINKRFFTLQSCLSINTVFCFSKIYLINIPFESLASFASLIVHAENIENLWSLLN